MNKAQLIEHLSDRFGGRRQAAEALDLILDTIQRTVTAGEKVVITGFGVFEKIDRPARTARNPATGERVRVKKTSVPKFRPGSDFKSFVSGAKKMPKRAVGAAKKATEAVTDAATGVAARKRSAGPAAAATTPAKAAKATTRKTSAAKTTTAKSTAGRAGTTKPTAKKSTAKTATSAKKAAPSTSAAGRSAARTGAAKTTKRAAAKA